MAEASSKKRIVTSVACEILAYAQACTSDCARMHRLELDEPNVRPWLKLCSVTRAACLAIAQERGTECEKRGLVPGGSCSQIRGDSRLIWESAAGAEEARIARDLGIGAGEGTVEDHVGPGLLHSLKGRSRSAPVQSWNQKDQWKTGWRTPFRQKQPWNTWRKDSGSWGQQDSYHNIKEATPRGDSSRGAEKGSGEKKARRLLKRSLRTVSTFGRPNQATRGRGPLAAYVDPPGDPGFPDIRPPKVSDAIRQRDARVRAWPRDRPCLHMQLRARWACAG